MKTTATLVNEFLKLMEEKVSTEDIKISFFKKLEKTVSNLKEMNLISSFDFVAVNKLIVKLFNRDFSDIIDFEVSATSSADEFLEMLYSKRIMHHCHEETTLEEEKAVASLNCSFGEKIVVFSCVIEERQEMLIHPSRLEADCNMYFCISNKDGVYKALFLI